MLIAPHLAPRHATTHLRLLPWCFREHFPADENKIGSC